MPVKTGKLPVSEVVARGGTSLGTTNTKIRRFTAATTEGTAITYQDSATLGASFNINEDGLYAVSYLDKSQASIGISKNASGTDLTTDVAQISDREKVVSVDWNSSGVVWSLFCSVTVKLAAGDVLRAHIGGTAVNDVAARFSIRRIQ